MEPSSIPKKIECPTLINLVRTSLNDPGLARKPEISEPESSIKTEIAESSINVPKMAHRMIRIRKRKMKVNN